MNSEIAKQRINEVLRPDTMTTSNGDFLATHVTVNGIELYSKYDINDPTKSVKFKEAESEEDVLNRFIINPGDRHQFILVMGESGAGKSHLIRWFNDRLTNNKPDNEVILFIRRSDNTLKGTIKQLLEKPEISNLSNKERYKRLVEATSVVDEKKLKGEILSKFILEVENDDNEDAEIQLKNTEKRRLAAFLKYKRIGEKLKDIDGPIDRIYLKVAQSGSVVTDVVASFKPEDFELDYEEIDDIEENADKDTIRMMHSLDIKEGKREEIAKYLNTFIDTVIQRCSGLEAGDFEEVFKDIRREIKKQGKKLTILIEDITSFTGVNTALLNALTTEHTGVGNDDLCRISSVVGITSGYFKDVFKTNYRDRTTLFINLPNDIFSETYLYEFFAKYLNTMSLGKDVIDNWANEGAQPSEYPIHAITEGSYWDYYEIGNGKKISLYPFTKKSIVNLYNYRLSTNQLRTPRYILQYIIEPIVKDALFRKANFPSLELKPYNNNPSAILRTKIFNMPNVDDDIKERLYLFTCLWGNGDDTISISKDGEKVISGISEKIYQELGLPLMTNLKQVNNELQNLDNKESNISLSSKNIEDSIDNDTQSKEAQRKIESTLDILEKWVNGSTINVGSTTGNVVLLSHARENIIKYLNSAIKWQCEGVSENNISKLNSSKYKLIGFERQLRGLDTALLVLPANRETQAVIEAFIRWEVEGKGSWNFENGEYFALTVETWTEKIKPNVIKAVNYILDRSINYYYFAVASEIYRQILFGQVKDWNTYSSDEFFENGILGVQINSKHCKEWVQLEERYERAKFGEIQRSDSLQYFNLIQGKGGSKIYLNREKFDFVFNEIKRNKLCLKYLDYQDMVSVRDEYRKNFSEINSRIHEVFTKEKEMIIGYVQSLNLLAGQSNFTQKEIAEMVDNAKDFYSEVNNAQLFVSYNAELLDKTKRDKKKISEALNIIDKILKEDDELTGLTYMSSDPIKDIMPLLKFVEKVQEDMQKISQQIEQNKAQILEKTGKNLEQPYSEEKDIIDKCGLSIERLGNR